MNDIIDMYRSGKSIREIERQTGKPRMFISEYIKMNGIKLRPKKDNSVTKKELERLYLKEQYPIRKIAQICNKSHEYIRRRINEFGIKMRHGGEAIKTQWIDADDRKKQQSNFYLSNLVKHGENHPQWKGGIEEKNGYLFEYSPNHKRANKGKVRQHILVAEKKIGRPLKKNEVVHHINQNRKDNRPENLEVMTNSEHSKLHWKLRKGEL